MANFQAFNLKFSMKPRESNVILQESDLGPELQYLLSVKEDLSYVLIFQHAILDAK